jgi:hypothetical protein
MKTFIVTCQSEYESASSLGLPCTVWDMHEDYRKDKDLLIRWGASGEESEDVGAFHVANPSKAIAANVRKLNAIRILARVVDTPKLFSGSVPAGVKVVYRPTRHSAGKGFGVKVGPFRIEYAHYATEYIKTDTEVRAWFSPFGIMVGKRVALARLKQTSNVEHPCRSEWGYSFITKPRGLEEQVMKAAKEIGLHFGAADILIHEGKYYFLELNSAPSVDCRAVREFYQRAIERYASSLKPQ